MVIELLSVCSNTDFFILIQQTQLLYYPSVVQTVREAGNYTVCCFTMSVTWGVNRWERWECLRKWVFQECFSLLLRLLKAGASLHITDVVLKIFYRFMFYLFILYRFIFVVVIKSTSMTMTNTHFHSLFSLNFKGIYTESTKSYVMVYNPVGNKKSTRCFTE